MAQLHLLYFHVHFEVVDLGGRERAAFVVTFETSSKYRHTIFLGELILS